MFLQNIQNLSIKLLLRFRKPVVMKGLCLLFLQSIDCFSRCLFHILKLSCRNCSGILVL